jgi:hypothetical protein
MKGQIELAIVCPRLEAKRWMTTSTVRLPWEEQNCIVNASEKPMRMRGG